jgi:competence transcription factor ComK
MHAASPYIPETLPPAELPGISFEPPALREPLFPHTVFPDHPAACTKQVHVKHPNQINDLDGYGYDSLIVAQGALDEAKVQLAAHKFDDRRSSAGRDHQRRRRRLRHRACHLGNLSRRAHGIETG